MEEGCDEDFLHQVVSGPHPGQRLDAMYHLCMDLYEPLCGRVIGVWADRLVRRGSNETAVKAANMQAGGQ